MILLMPRTLGALITGIIFVIVPALLGIFARTTRRATLWSVLVGVTGAGLIVSPRSLSGALSPVVAAAMISGAAGWLAHKLAAFFRADRPRTAIRNTLVFLLLLGCKLVALLVVVDALGNVVITDFAQEFPEIVYLRWNERVYLYAEVAFALVLVCLWSYLYTRPSTRETTSTVRLAFYRVVPFLFVILVFMPILMAWVQIGLSVPLLDCAATKFPSYVPDMVDYTRLVLDSLARGSMLGLGSKVVQIATCAPMANIVALMVVLGLKLAPISIVAWLAFRAYRVRT